MMKKIVYLSICLLPVLFAGCNNYSYEEVDNRLTALDLSQLFFTAKADSKTIIIELNGITEPLRVTSSKTWCNATTSGSSVTISVEPNGDLPNRTALLTVTSGAKKIEIPVTQYGLKFSVESNNVTFSIAGGERRIGYDSETPPTITSSAGWVTGTVDPATKQIVLTVDPYATPNIKRQAVVTAKVGVLEAPITVMQDTYTQLTVNKTQLNTAGGNSMLDPFLTLYNTMVSQVEVLPRYVQYFTIAFSSTTATPPKERMTLTIRYTNAANTGYDASVFCDLNRDTEGNVYFTNMYNWNTTAAAPGTLTAGNNMSTLAPRVATNILSFFLYSGTGEVRATSGASGTLNASIPASGNKFKIDWAPNNTPGVISPGPDNKLVGFYVVGNESMYMPGVPGN